MERRIDIPRVVIAGTHSGVGKTTIVAGLLAAYKEAGKKVQSFKVGPDYIDPGFHKMASGRESFNLDTWLVPAEDMVPFFIDRAGDCDLAIIEGVMGLYDGGKSGISSTADIAKRLQAPVVLIIDAKAMAESAVAIALGFKTYDPEVDFKGVILNRLGSPGHERMIREAMEKIGIPVIGAIHRHDDMKSPERHLGLTPVTEFDPANALQAAKEAMQKEVDLEALETLAKDAPALLDDREETEVKDKVAKIGVAYDEAFSFYYPASLEALEKEGAEIVYFSPLRDEMLPDVDALFFGGGFPEMFLESLCHNVSMKESVRKAAEQDMPIYAECGGLMYLCESITHFDGTSYPTCGVVPAKTVMQEKLQRVGYVEATIRQDCLLGAKNSVLRGHEFHFSTMEPQDGFTEDSFPWAFSLEGGRKGTEYLGGYVSSDGKIVASYLHMNFAGNKKAAARFVEAAAQYRKD